MWDSIQKFFRDLAERDASWNFIYIYDDNELERVLEGMWVTLELSVVCVVFSVVIGLVGAWLQGARSRVVRSVVQGYIQFFRNTPPLVQLMFFYFALGQFTPTYSPDGYLQQPIVSNVGWAIISLSFFAGAFNVENLPRRHRGGAAIDPGGRRIPRHEPLPGLCLCRAAARLPGQPAGA